MSEHLHPGSHLDADQLSAFAEGVLPEHERQASLAHLAECTDCRRIAFLAHQPEPAPVTTPAPTPAWRRWFAPLPVFTAALAGVALVIIFLHLHQTTTPAHAPEVAKIETPNPQPLVPTEQAPAAPRAVTPGPSPHKTPAAQPDAGNVSIASSNAASGMLSIHGALPATAPAPAQPPTGQESLRNLAQTKPALSDTVQADAAAPVFTNGKAAFAPQQFDANAAAAPAAAPPLPAAKPSQIAGAGRGLSQAPATATISSQELADLPIAGRNVTALAAISPGLTIEHNRGSAATLSELTGSVTDPAGAALPGAIVTARRPIDATPSQAKTDAAGRFTLAALPAGHYEIRIAAPGFMTITQQIDLQPRDLALFNPTLSIGAMSETVDVSTANATIDTESQAVSNVVKSKRLRKLPSKLPTVTSVTSGNLTLTLDSEGALFLSHDAGKHWQPVKPTWQGQISQLTLLPEPPASADAKSLDALSDDASAIAAPPTPARFKITTDAHAVWVSNDGLHWRPQQN